MNKETKCDKTTFQENQPSDKGILYLVATPIGNLKDITLRALEILKSVDAVLAEDTRHTLKLFNFYNIKNKLISYHKFNQKQKEPFILSWLKNNKSMALVTNAGTPAIQDPGEDLVKLCLAENIKVISIPGASSVLTALTSSGFSTKRFVFEGFLPAKKQDIEKILEELKKETRTIILFSSPHDLQKTLNYLYQYLGNRKICLARELTKKFEEIKSDCLENILKNLDSEKIKGEYTLLIEGCNPQNIEFKISESEVEKMLQDIIEKKLEPKKTLKEMAIVTNIPKNKLYNILLKIKKKKV